MRLEIRFRHMDRSEPLETLVTEKTMAAVSGFLHRHDAHIQIWLICERSRLNRGTPLFVCEIEVRYPPKKDFFISKKNMDMHIAIQEATDSLKLLLDEAGKKEISLRNSSSVIP